MGTLIITPIQNGDAITAASLNAPFTALAGLTINGDNCAKPGLDRQNFSESPLVSVVRAQATNNIVITDGFTLGGVGDGSQTVLTATPGAPWTIKAGQLIRVDYTVHVPTVAGTIATTEEYAWLFQPGWNIGAGWVPLPGVTANIRANWTNKIAVMRDSSMGITPYAPQTYYGAPTINLNKPLVTVRGSYSFIHTGADVTMQWIQLRCAGVYHYHHFDYVVGSENVYYPLDAAHDPITITIRELAVTVLGKGS